MHIEMIGGAIKSYAVSLGQNASYKFLAGMIPGVAATIMQGHQELINLVFLLYFLDFGTGLAYVLKTRTFESGKFFKGAIKLAVYGILLAVALSIDKVLHSGEMIIGIMFTYIILTDSSSIIENLHKLGFNVPIFLIKYLGVAKDRLDHKVGDILGLSDQEKEEIKNYEPKRKTDVQ